MSFHSLKLSYDACQTLLNEMRHARGWAADGLRSMSFPCCVIPGEVDTNMIVVALEPLLDADKNYTRAGEIKALVGELQDELAGCTYRIPCPPMFSIHSYNK